MEKPIYKISNISAKSFRLHLNPLSGLTYQDLMKCALFGITLTHLQFPLFSVDAESFYWNFSSCLF